MQFLNESLVVEKNNYLTKIVNVYIVYDPDYWPRNPLNSFTLKNCLFDATNLVKNAVYSSYRIVFDGAGSQNFVTGFARNVVFFGVDNSSSPHTDYRKNNFLV